MKVKFFLLIICSLFCFMNCSNDDGLVPTGTFDGNRFANAGFKVYYIGTFDETSEINISNEPNHATHSEIYYDQGQKKAYYRYKPEYGYIGTDEVVISAKNIDDHEGIIYKTFYIYIY